MSERRPQYGFQNSIQHILCERQTELRAELCRLLPDPSLADQLLLLGSVYLNGQRVNDPEQGLKIGDILRVHTRPRRYPVDSWNWPARIVRETDDFVVINKPAEIPTHPTLDNAIENVKYVIERTLTCPLWVTHRLDQPTSGLLVLAKSHTWAARFHQALANRQVQKIYHAWAQSPPPIGLHHHHMVASPRSPKIILPTNQGPLKTYPCELDILSVTELAQSIFCVKMTLLTGRTHQIRAQLSFLGSPILGDNLYGSPRDLPLGIALLCSELHFLDQTFTLDAESFYSFIAKG